MSDSTKQGILLLAVPAIWICLTLFAFDPLMRRGITRLTGVTLVRNRDRSANATPMFNATTPGHGALEWTYLLLFYFVIALPLPVGIGVAVIRYRLAKGHW
jgi:hypothetical protein